jgi:exodeoxyribonuclease X
MASRTIRIIDTETSGLDPAVDRVVEIALFDLIVGDDGEIARGRRWSSLINPEIPIPCTASAIHDITDEMVKDAPTFRDVVDEWRSPAPFAFCAHNSRFDRSFIDPVPELPWICSYKVAIWLWPDCPSHSNACLRYWLKLKLADDAGPRHRASGDSYITAAIMRRALLTGATIEQMIDVSSKPAVLPRLHFGMHAGKPIADLPDSYLTWMLRQDGMDEDAKNTAFVEMQRRRAGSGEYPDGR